VAKKKTTTARKLKITRIDINISAESNERRQASFDLSATISEKETPILDVYNSTSVKLTKSTIDLGKQIGEALTKFIADSATAASCSIVELDI